MARENDRAPSTPQTEMLTALVAAFQDLSKMIRQLVGKIPSETKSEGAPPTARRFLMEGSESRLDSIRQDLKDIAWAQEQARHLTGLERTRALTSIEQRLEDNNQCINRLVADETYPTDFHHRFGPLLERQESVEAFARRYR